MRTPRAMHRGGIICERSHWVCLIRPGRIALVILAVLFGFGSPVQAQIGNLDWASGEKAAKQRKQVDYENVKFRMLMEPGIGRDKYTYKQVMKDDASNSYEHENSEIMVDLAIGGIYRIIQIGGSGPKIDISLYITVGANLVEFDFDELRLLGVAAPEIGVTPPGGNLYFRPFVSFGPGMSVLENLNDKGVALVGVLRAGIEIGTRKGPLAGTLAIKRIGRGKEEYSTYERTDTESESDLLLTLGLRYKIAL